MVLNFTDHCFSRKEKKNSVWIILSTKLFSLSRGGQNKHRSSSWCVHTSSSQGPGQQRFQRKQFLQTNIFKITFNTTDNYFRIPLHVWQNWARHCTRYLWQLNKVVYCLDLFSIKINQKFRSAEICYWYSRLSN